MIVSSKEPLTNLTHMINSDAPLSSHDFKIFIGTIRLFEYVSQVVLLLHAQLIQSEIHSTTVSQTLYAEVMKVYLRISKLLQPVRSYLIEQSRRGLKENESYIHDIQKNKLPEEMKKLQAFLKNIENLSRSMEKMGEEATTHFARLKEIEGST
jgi:hypothetical protein